MNLITQIWSPASIVYRRNFKRAHYLFTSFISQRFFDYNREKCRTIIVIFTKRRQFIYLENLENFTFTRIKLVGTLKYR